MVSIRKFLIGLGLIPNPAGHTADTKGELEVITADSRLFYHNGTSAQPILTDTNTATVTNKSMDGGSNTFTNLPGGTAISGQVPVANGGTGDASLTAHGLLIGNGTSPVTVSSVGATNTVLHGNTGADPTFSAVSLTADVSGILPVLNGGTGTTTSTGTGSVVLSNSPTFVTPALGTPSALVGTNITGTASSLTAGNINASSNSTLTTLSALSLPGSQVTGNISGNAANVTGIVAVANGGTGDSTLAAHGVLIGNGTGAVAVTSAGTAGQVLTSNGPSADPTYQPAGTASPLTTKGDLYTYSTVNDRLPVGTNGQHLSADSTQSTGIKWITSGRTINAQTGTTYTFVLADGSATDGNPLVTASNAAAQTYTVPLNASVAFPIGTQIDVTQLGAGLVTFAAAGGVTINALSGGLSMLGQYAAATLIKTATDTWELYGTSTITVAAPRSEVQVSGFTQLGATNTKVIQFSTANKNTGTDITYATSASLGDSFTVNTAGVYCVSYSAEGPSNPVQMAITVNGTALSTDPATPLTYAQGARKLAWANTTGFGSDISWCGILAVNDVIRFHANVSLRNDFRSTASVVKVSN